MEIYSEFEGTVLQDHSNILGAGPLEELLGLESDGDVSSRSLKKRAADLEKDCGDLCIGIYDLNQATQKWQSLNLTSVMTAWDDSADQLARKRDDYLTNRRSKLKGEVKKYDERFFTENQDNIDAIKGSISATIDLFKTEYDYLASLYKYSEGLYLEIHKYMRDVPDPLTSFDLSARLCSKAHDTIKSSKDLLKLASDKLESISISKANALNSSNSDALLKYEKEIETIKNIHKQELKEIKSKFDSDIKLREQRLLESLQNQHADSTSHLQAAIESKDNQIASLMKSLSDTRSHTLELEERDKSYMNEIQKRRDLEDKLRGAVVDLSASESKNASLSVELESAMNKNQLLERQIVVNSQAAELSIKDNKQEIASLKLKLESLEMDLKARPPTDCSKRIISSLRKISGDFLTAGSSFEDIENPNSCLPWEKAESLICDAVRLSHSLAIDARLERQKLEVELDDIKAELQTCRADINDKTRLIAELERDCLISNAAPSGKVNVVLLTGDDSAEDKANGGVNSIASSASSSSDKMIAALQSQRDRFMKMSSDREREIDALKQSIEASKSSIADLKKENMELYGRLQSVRSTNRQNMNGKDVEVDEEASLSRLAEFSDNEDSIDSKYGKVYRNSSDNNSYKHGKNNSNILFTYLDSLDRIFLVSFNSITRDKLIRRLLILYLFIMQALALGYVFQVINPLLVEEVAAINHDKYAAETLSIDMFSEHPDV